MQEPEAIPRPVSAARLPAWATELGVEDFLDRPVRELAAYLPYGNARFSAEVAPGAATIRTVIVNGKVSLYRVRGAEMQELFRAACTLLEAEARERKIRQARQQLWAIPPREVGLLALSARLHLLLARLRAFPEVWDPLVSARASSSVLDYPPRLDIDFSAAVRGTYFHTGACSIRLDPNADDAISWACTCTAHRPARPYCVHLRMGAEFLLDGVHDETHELHAGLAELMRVAPWSRLLKVLQKTIPEMGPAPAVASERLAWRLLHDGDHIHLEPIVQKRTARGGWSRGRVMVYNQVSTESPFCGEEDTNAVERLQYLTATGRLREGFGQILEALTGHPRVFLGAEGFKPVEVRSCPVRIGVRAAGAETLALGISFAGTMLSGSELGRCRLGRHHLARIDTGREICQVGQIPESIATAVTALAQYHAHDMPRAALGEVLAVLARLAEHAELEIDPSLGGESVPLEAVPLFRLAPLATGGLELRIVVRAPGHHAALSPGEGPRALLRRDGERVVQLARDLDGERRIAESVLDRLHLPAAASRGSWHFEVTDPEAALDLVLALKELGDEVGIEWAEGAAWRVGQAHLPSLKVRVSRQGNLFGLDGEVEVDGEKVPLSALLTAVRRGQRYVPLGPGRFARIERELRQRLESASRITVGDGHGGMALGALGVTRLRAILGEDVALKGDHAYSDLLARVKTAGRLEPALPDGLRVELRPYQVDGFRWLARLAAWRAGALLADDMGLGKTVQALALLLHRAAEGPALVVAPTSVCAGWQIEAQRFAPGLDVILFRGPRRQEALARLGPGVVLVASYDILALDIEALEKVRFATLVLDEAQVVKNAVTQRARAARRIVADLALALTGTPLENHLGELWSIVRIVSPGLLGSWDHFRERFAVPIERHREPAALADLVTTLRPFLLRRTKAEVAPELPPRTEIVKWVILSHAEREIYEAARREVLEGLATGGGTGERFEILAAITRLRLLACHPRLVDPSTDVHSAKLDAAVSVIANVLETGQRALVFSQFTSHFALLREELDRRAIPYLYLDGSTPPEARDRSVKAWQEGGHALFLLSLKAGGRGLNLMGADCVLHLDPWWNPAVEDQATDRTHRIGQDRPVTVVRLITRGTIEEAVLALHDVKRELASNVLDGAAVAGAVSTEELVALIRGVAPAPADGEVEEEAPENGGAETQPEGAEREVYS